MGDTGADHLAAALKVNKVRIVFVSVSGSFKGKLLLDRPNSGMSVKAGAALSAHISSY